MLEYKPSWLHKRFRQMWCWHINRKYFPRIKHTRILGHTDRTRVDFIVKNLYETLKQLYTWLAPELTWTNRKETPNKHTNVVDYAEGNKLEMFISALSSQIIHNASFIWLIVPLFSLPVKRKLFYLIYWLCKIIFAE